LFKKTAEHFKIPSFEHLKICASSDIDEEVLQSLSLKGHEIDIFGIGTNLVTCSTNPALGCVYKLVQIGNIPRIKLSNNVAKVTIPGRKEGYRLCGKDGPVVDLMVEHGTPAPKVGEPIYCRHPFNETKRCVVRPSEVIPLHHLVWDGKIVINFPTLEEIRQHCVASIDGLRPDHKYSNNPTPYKVSLSQGLYRLFHDLWLTESPIEELV